MRGAILAGGSASRFSGRPKGLEQVGGDRIIDRVARSLQAATGQPPILVANAADAGKWRPDLTVVGDAIRDCGSLGGIYTSLIVAEGPVLVVAWDMPFVSVELLEELIRRSDGYDVFLPARAGSRTGVEPLCGVYAPGCQAAIRERLADEDLRATGFLDFVKVGTLTPEETAQFGNPDTLFFNVNTPADLTKAQELWRDSHGT